MRSDSIRVDEIEASILEAISIAASESGSVLHWDGFTENGTTVPSGVYLLQCSIGSDVSTGSFVVRRD